MRSYSFHRILFVLSILLVGSTIPSSLFAQDENSNIDSSHTGSTINNLPRVISAFSNDSHELDEICMGEEIYIQVENKKTLLQRADSLNKNIVLFINDIPVKSAVFVNEAEGLSFLLESEGDVLDIWNHLLASRETDEFFSKEVSISVGIDGEEPVETFISEENNKAFKIILIDKTWFWTAILVILILIGVFIRLATKTDMLRDASAQPVQGRKPYSLARTQMGIWTIAIITSWLFLYVCLHHFGNLTDSTLVLLGITAATGVGGVAMSSRGSVNTSNQASRGFFNDLVADSLFRFQNVAWTFVLVIIFIRSVIIFLKMPEFDEKLLLLMGISSGTYLGAKVSEKAPDPITPENELPSNVPPDENNSSPLS